MRNREIEDRVQRAIPLIQYPDSKELWEEIEYLGTYGTNHPAAIDFLIKCINDHFRWDRYIYWKALYNLSKISEPGITRHLPPEILEEILYLLEPGSRGRLDRLVQLIGSFSPQFFDAIMPRLAQTLAGTKLIAAITKDLEPYKYKDTAGSSRRADCETATNLGAYLEV